MRSAVVSVSREAHLTAAMSGHDTVLRGCVLRTGQLLYLGLGQIFTVDRDIGPTFGALKDGLAPVIFQRCFGPGMWWALLRHGAFPSTDE